MENKELSLIVNRYSGELREMRGGIQAIFRFPNGYGASVINHMGSYGVELAVIKFDKNGIWHITYETPITDDVIGYIENEKQLRTLLMNIEALHSPE